ncbi:hypothetical protein MYU51_018977 [Penicillium brevicompactum]|uniref:uncharacterized protein n=1 Tax=Penicillium brevicompactum TaxID=5074 RepID=UPI002541E078|nr:uncharacterized protein N7506_006343 [Penicillium brevicompactum]KAJ5332560.1 hypothetical protein N7506_006343 [Penicillium brevicompactum]
MHNIPPFLSLGSTFRSRSKSPSAVSDYSTSAPSSPTSLHRSSSHHNFFNFSFHPKPHTTRDQDRESNTSIKTNATRPRPASDIPHGHNSSTHAVGVLPCAVLRGRSSMMVLRSRPSKVDMVLTEERSRCDGNPIERQGLGLMEPRPVEQGRGEMQPSVMGGIFEVMEGRA